MTERDGSYIDPSPEQVSTFAAAAKDGDGPVVMLNLLAFKAEGGLDSYLKYGVEVQPHLDRVGATILYAGSAGQVLIGAESEPWWDMIILVSYPSRSKFLEMVLDADYQAISVYRSEALETSGLIATVPVPTG